MIRINNQVRYKLFGYSGAPGVITGENGQLIEKAYLDEYCKRNLATFEPKARDWAAKLKEIQDFYAARGKIFIYLITPSKVAYMPENFASALSSCASSVRDRTGMLPLYDGLLKEAGVHVVDAASLIYGLKGKYEIDLFPAGGVHWNAIGIATADDAILAEINRQAGSAIAPKLSWKYKVVDRAKGTDRDLLDLLNVLSPDARYATASVTYEPKEPCSDACCRLAQCRDDRGKLCRHARPHPHQSGVPLPPRSLQLSLSRHRRRARLQDRQTTAHGTDILPLRDDDIVILEENELVLPASAHAMEFYRVILGR